MRREGACGNERTCVISAGQRGAAFLALPSRRGFGALLLRGMSLALTGRRLMPIHVVYSGFLYAAAISGSSIHAGCHHSADGVFDEFIFPIFQLRREVSEGAPSRSVVALKTSQNGSLKPLTG